MRNYKKLCKRDEVSVVENVRNSELGEKGIRQGDQTRNCRQIGTVGLAYRGRILFGLQRKVL